jgi:hypothetical protein
MAGWIEGRSRSREVVGIIIFLYLFFRLGFYGGSVVKCAGGTEEEVLGGYCMKKSEKVGNFIFDSVPLEEY